MRKPQHIAVVTVNRDKYSETFIHKSYAALSGRKTLLYGGYFPTHFTSKREEVGQEFPSRPKRFFWNKRRNENEVETAKENLKYWLAENKVDVVLAHYGPSGLAMMELCAEMNIPLVVHFHGYDAYRSDILEEQGRRYPELFQHAAAIVAVSEDMKSQLLHLGANEDQLHLLHYGIETSFWQAQAIVKSPLQFLFVGRFVEKKSPGLVLQSFAKLVAGIPEAKLGMIGEGPLLGECKALAIALGISKAVEFMGACSEESVRNAIWESRALILPSQVSEIGDSEGTPLVILEAGACGRPVIGTRHGGIVDVVKDGENGRLVNQGDAEGLANAMKMLADDIELARKMGMNGQAIIRSQFEARHYHQKLFDLCCTVLPNNG